MHRYYEDYRWQEGRPRGIGKTSRGASLCYRIVSDPYHKWLSIEMYERGLFKELLYDSRLLDFRKLSPTEQLSWRKEPAGLREAWIFNEDDRVILLESYRDGGCEIYSPHGVLLCRYAFLPEEARIVLFDGHSHPVMTRQYRTYEKGEFLDILREDWFPILSESAV
ncbi:MAG: hypothetical protein JJU12_05685 [Chlamydiales bacterium]|nr:hypothetical protein [Chlamydiales bacterium]